MSKHDPRALQRHGADVDDIAPALAIVEARVAQEVGLEFREGIASKQKQL